LAVAPPALAAPSVVSESASQITASDATLEATIATQPAEHVLTQFQLATSPSELSPEFQCPRELAPSGGPEGKGGSSLCLELHGVTPFPIQGAEPPGEIVRLNLARIVTLIPSTTYYYRTLAAKEHFPFGDVWVVEPPVVYAATQSFTTISSSPPTVAHVEPNHGPPRGGTTLTITGTGFAGATAVSFGPSLATSFTVNSATSVTAVSPKGKRTVDITVTTPSGTSSSNAEDQFTYSKK
jgi:hypothetical protein